MTQENPYLKKKPIVKAPPILRVPMYSFDSGAAVEEELELEELCIASIPNTKPTGYVSHVALVYKDELGKVYSAVMVQHQGALKEGTVELLKQEDEAVKRTEQKRPPLPPQNSRKKKKYGRK